MRTLTRLFNIACARLYVWAQVTITTEPVRVRAWLTSALIALSVVVPALANQETAATVAGIGMTALTVIIGESARSRVTPVDGT